MIYTECEMNEWHKRIVCPQCNWSRNVCSTSDPTGGYKCCPDCGLDVDKDNWKINTMKLVGFQSSPKFRWLKPLTWLIEEIIEELWCSVGIPVFVYKLGE
jgi:hypothetical protein